MRRIWESKLTFYSLDAAVYFKRVIWFIIASSWYATNKKANERYY